jgi:hypothetical protein
MYKNGSCCWPVINPAVNHAAEAVNLVVTELAVAPVFLPFIEVFLLLEPKG